MSEIKREGRESVRERCPEKRELEERESVRERRPEKRELEENERLEIREEARYLSFEEERES